jgi:hypothetical protein
MAIAQVVTIHLQTESSASTPGALELKTEFFSLRAEGRVEVRFCLCDSGVCEVAGITSFVSGHDIAGTLCWSAAVFSPLISRLSFLQGEAFCRPAEPGASERDLDFLIVVFCGNRIRCAAHGSLRGQAAFGECLFTSFATRQSFASWLA